MTNGKRKKKKKHPLAKSTRHDSATRIKKVIQYICCFCILHIFTTYIYIFFKETAEANVLFSFIKESAQSGALHDKMEEQSKESINCKLKHFDFIELDSVVL